MSRRPSRLRRRQRPWGRVQVRPRAPARTALLAAVTALMALTTGGPLRIPTASAADDPGRLLDATLIDAAWVDRGSSGPPDLLTMSLGDDQVFGSANLTLLRRAGTWRIQAQTQLQFGSDFDGGAPWFVQLGPGRFAIVANTNNATGTITTVNVDESNLGAITIDRRVDTEIAVSAAGVTDANGDGTRELVLGGVIGGYEAECPTMAVAVLDTDERLSLRSQAAIQAADGSRISYFVGSAFGEFDGRRGMDLLTQAYACPSGDTQAYHVLAVRLADLSTIHDLQPALDDPGISDPLSNAPVVVDVDRDGRNEAVFATTSGMNLVDPTDGWRITTFGSDRVALVGTVEPSGGQPGTSIVELRSTGDPSTSGVAVARLSRVDGRIRVDEGEVRPTGWVPQEALAASVRYLRESTWADQPPVMVDDLDGDDCPDLVAPLVLIGCAGTGTLQPAPAWTATRPLAVVGNGSDRKLLVAVGLDWYASPGGTVAPSPLAAHRVDAWHVNNGNRFALAEVPIGQRNGPGPVFSTPVVPPPAIERAASQEGIVDVRRPAGTRLLTRVIASGGTGNIRQNATVVATPLGFLYSDLLDTEWVGPASTLTNLPSAIGYGSDAATDRLMLAPNVMNQDGTIANRWTITIAALDATGTLSTPVQATAVLDVEDPVVKVETPMFSAPWPFTGTVHGTSEPGATVSLAGDADSPVVVGADGTFAIPIQLAPWPQDIAVRAVDPAGNEGRATASIMGGVDLRGLPWPAIGVVVVLVAVFLSSIRGVRGAGARPVRQVAVDTSDENATVIEELSAGRIQRD